MQKPTKRLLTIFVPILTALLLILFWEAITGIPKQHSLWSMDGSPLYNHDFKTQTWQELTGRHWRLDMLGMPGKVRVFQPDDILKFIFPPLVYHLMSWILVFLVMTGAMLYFLYSYGIKGLRAALPALAYGFSGYTFTLISAGHRATPMTMGYAVLAMALVRNGMRKNTIWHFVAAGLACVYGIINQQDVMGFMLILIAAYAVLQLILHWPMYQWSEVGSQRSALKASNQPETTNQELRTKNPPTSHSPDLTSHVPHIAKLAAAICLAAATFLLVGWPFLSQTFFGATTGRSTIESRQQQIERSGGDRWEFITNWSLPPEGVLEFIAPSVFGRENVSREVPYWGRLGQSMNWPETKQGFRNFRQHNLYVGGIQLTLALYAIFFLFRKGVGGWPRKRRIEVMFWLTATILTLLLALGRYTPLYRIIYHLPVIGNIRAPVKWFHLTEITIVILMAFGLDALLKDLQARAESQTDRKHKKQEQPSRLPVRFACGTTITAVVLLLASTIAQSTGFGLQSLWAAHGLEPIAPQLRNALAGSLFHATLVFAALAAILWLLLKYSHTQTKIVKVHRLSSNVYCLMSILLAVLALDLAIAHKPYIHVQDVSAFYAPNPIADIILQDNPPYRVADYLTSRGKHDPLWRNFTMKGVDMLLPQAGQTPPEDVQSLYEALQNNPIRLWQLTSTRYIIGQRQQLANITKHPEIRTIASFRITQDARIKIDDSNQAPFIMLEYGGALPLATHYTDWQLVDHPSKALEILQSPDFNPVKQAVVISTDQAMDPRTDAQDTSLQISDYQPNASSIKLQPDARGLILYTSRHNGRWKTDKGKLLSANGPMQGVYLPHQTNHVTRKFTAIPSVQYSVFAHSGIGLYFIGLLAITLLKRKASKRP